MKNLLQIISSCRAPKDKLNRVLRLENQAPPKKRRPVQQPTLTTHVKVFRRHKARLTSKENHQI